jgi:hypothetical protein
VDFRRQERQRRRKPQHRPHAEVLRHAGVRGAVLDERVFRLRDRQHDEAAIYKRSDRMQLEFE